MGDIRLCQADGVHDVLSPLRYSYNRTSYSSMNVQTSSISRRRFGEFRRDVLILPARLTCYSPHRLEHFLNEETRTLVVISHDQAFLTAVVEETIILRNQSLKYFEGTPAAFEVEEKKEAKRLIGQKEALDKKRDHIEKSIEKGKASAKKTGDENREVSYNPSSLSFSY